MYAGINYQGVGVWRAETSCARLTRNYHRFHKSTSNIVRMISGLRAKAVAYRHSAKAGLQNMNICRACLWLVIIAPSRHCAPKEIKATSIKYVVAAHRARGREVRMKASRGSYDSIICDIFIDDYARRAGASSPVMIIGVFGEREYLMVCSSYGRLKWRAGETK